VSEAPHTYATAQGESVVLARIYRRAILRFRQNAAEKSGGDGAFEDAAKRKRVQEKQEAHMT
jgi:hypothetical protein